MPAAGRSHRTLRSWCVYVYGLTFILSVMVSNGLDLEKYSWLDVLDSRDYPTG